MKPHQIKNIVYPFLFLTSFGVFLYIGYFSWFLLKAGASPFQASMLIGITCLSSLFWGPLAGRIIDRSKKKCSGLRVGNYSAQSPCYYLATYPHLK